VLVAPAAEITTFSEVIVVYKFLGDLMFYVTGSQDENELILYQVLQGFYESISLLLRCAANSSRQAPGPALSACRASALLRPRCTCAPCLAPARLEGLNGGSFLAPECGAACTARQQEL
jgi:hypothetical protein